MTQAVRYWLLSSDIRQQLTAYLSHKLENWQQHWGFQFTDSWKIELTPGQEVNKAEINAANVAIYSNDQSILSLTFPKNKQVLTSQILKSNHIPSNSPLLNHLLETVLIDLCQKLGDKWVQQNPYSQTAKTDQQNTKNKTNSSHFIKAELTFKQMNIPVFLSMTLIDAIVDRAPEPNIEKKALEDRLIGIGDETVSVNVDYGSADVSVYDLSTIKVGDVIRLSKPINLPTLVKDKNGTPLFSGYLGTKEGYLALKIKGSN